MDLSIIIVSWNVREKLKDNLRAIFESKNINFEVFVVDNNSADDTVSMIKKHYPQVKLIANQENLGFAKANNQAIKQASGEYVLLLNPDMRVFDDTLARMFSWMNAHEKAWVATCRLIDESARVVRQVRQFPTLLNQLFIALKIPHIFPGVLKKYLREDFDYKKAAVVDSIRGAFFMIRREATEKIGLLDERFFLWFEEVDYCKRVKEAGGEVWYMPTAECIDLVGLSFVQVDVLIKQKYFRDSMLSYFKKWRPAYEYYILKFVWPIGFSIVKIMQKINIKGRART